MQLGQEQAAGGERLHVAAERFFGGDAAGGGVGLGEIAFVAQVGHDVSDGGGAEVILAASRDSTRGYWFAVLDVRLNDRMQDVLFAASHCFFRGSLIIDCKEIG